MGLLDDAIREHLELKRAHGASEDEIVRAEQEALAPARRDPSAEAAAPAGDLPEETPEGAAEPVAEAPLDEAPPPVAEEPAEDAPPPPIEAVPTEEHEIEPAAAELEEPAPADSIADEATRIREVMPHEDELPHEDESELPPAGDGPVEAPEPGTPKPHGDELEDEFDPDETVADDHLSPDPDRFRARTSILDDPLDESEPPPPAQPPAEGESQDVLEETPDFLQETPEHDKLWFEQKPPRDFDFD